MDREITDPEAEAEAIAVATAEPVFIEHGTRAYGITALALFGAGFSTFSLLWCVQPLLPAFSAEFGVAPAESSLALSLTTGFLAAAILLAGPVSESRTRKGLMGASLCASAILNLLVALAPTWPALLALRALEGFALGGVPAVAMAYLSEEMHPRALGGAMGVYIAGNAFGGMSGRVITGILAGHLSWRLALGAVSGLALATCLLFVLLLPPSRNFVPRRGLGTRHHLAQFRFHLTAPGLPLLFVSAMLVMGSFITVYNYAGYRLAAPPFGLSQTAISLIFLAYLLGMVSSAWFGRLADRVGRGRMMAAGLATMAAGLAATLTSSVPAIALGIALVTIGFFGAHAVASGWVGRMAAGAKGHAASLYLLAYYVGASLMGSVGGFFWSHGGWGAVSAFVAALMGAQLVVTLRLMAIERDAARP